MGFGFTPFDGDHIDNGSIYRQSFATKSVIMNRNEALKKTGSPMAYQLLAFPFNYTFMKGPEYQGRFLPSSLSVAAYKLAFDKNFSVLEFCEGVKTAYEALRPVLIKRGEREMLQQWESDIPPVSTESMDTPQEMDFFIRSVTTDSLYSAIQEYYRDLIKDQYHLCGELDRVESVVIHSVLTRANPRTGGTDTTIVAVIRSLESIQLRNDKNEIIFGSSDVYSKTSVWFFERLDGENEWKLAYMET